jgi:hypothetical protein
MIPARAAVLSSEGHRIQGLLAEWRNYAKSPQSTVLSKDAFRYSLTAGFMFGDAAVKAAKADLRMYLDRCHRNRATRR